MYRILLTLLSICLVCTTGCLKEDEETSNGGNGGITGEAGGEAGAAGEGGAAGEAGAAGEGGAAGEAGAAGEGGAAGEAGAGGQPPLRCSEEDCGDAIPAIACMNAEPILTCEPNADGTACEWNIECPEACEKDVDRDGICEPGDTRCNVDGQQLRCRRAEPRCPEGQVPEVVNGCFSDRECVSWEECGRPAPPAMPCGGIDGVLCPEGSFCEYPEDGQCGEGDSQGTCVPHEPDGPCTRELFWVCGCDGVSYQNRCLARRGGTSVASVGRCERENEICGTRGAPPCEDGEYCKYPRDADCGRTDRPGVCTPFTPQMNCNRNWDPVCGCDGETYANECNAEAAGVSVDFSGACETEGTPCRLDGNDCGEDEFCFFPEGADCGRGRFEGVCKAIDPNAVCPTIFEPVCGCDGMTYSNSCVAVSTGASIASIGACESSCQNDADCPMGEWCRDDFQGNTECTPFQQEGESCGGFVPPEFRTRCAPNLHCSHENPNIPDLPGTCRPLCMADAECGMGMTCNIVSDSNPNGPCLSNCVGNGPCPEVCYGYCVPTGNACGGFLGALCPPGQVCLDDPADACDPVNGGADCPGICQVECTPDECGPAPRPLACEGERPPRLECVRDERGDCGWIVEGPTECPAVGAVGDACGQDGDQPCGDALYCKAAEGDTCYASQSGSCQPRPEVCTRDLRPVCGCDGNTYSNACTARAQGVEVASAGACGGAECGGLLDVVCPQGQYCKHAAENRCGSTGETGVCVGLEDPNDCPRLGQPVCGCDGQTYANPCRAGVAGVSIASEGPCQPGFCGGFAGFECERGWICVDAPDDGCDPEAGGADCPGICVEPGDVPMDRCTGDRDCGERGWCREDRNGDGYCVPFARQGQSCGGSTGPWNVERCNPATHHCAFEGDPPPPGAAGICAPYCMNDDECRSPAEVCVRDECLTPAGSNLAVCYGYCFARNGSDEPVLPPPPQ